MDATFTVTDLYLASFLMARGHTVRVVKLPGSVALGQPSRCQFLFSPAAEDDARAFDGGAAISAPMFADALKRLKGLVYRAPLATGGR